MADETAGVQSDVDRDSLHILPLVILPIQTPGLRRARVIKNARLESVVELFSGVQTGSGQIDIEGLASEFSWPADDPHADLSMMRRLGTLPSYDVYSLRVQLRNLQISVIGHDALVLSKKKNEELAGYMSEFTRPLLTRIYGDDDVEIKSFEDVIRLFKDPDVQKARERLKTMAATLEIEVHDIPKFLEDYGDIFMSLAYYRECLDSIAPIVEGFLYSLSEIESNWQLKSDANLIKTCERMRATFNSLFRNVKHRFKEFDDNSRQMWENLSAEQFRRVENMIRNYHVTIGGMLCALTVKMDAWHRLFPSPQAGGPIKRAEFIMTELRQGIDKMENLERTHRL